MPDFAAEAAMKCKEPLFIQFLADSTDVDVSDPEFAAKALRKLCEVSSRSQFNSNQDAADRWIRAKRWFGMWRVGYGKMDNGLKRPPFLMGEVAHSRGADMDENPFQPGLPEDEIDKHFDLWDRGYLVSKWRSEHDTRLLEKVNKKENDR